MAEGVTEAERQGRREGPHCVVGHGVDLALLYWGGGGADNAAAVVRAHQEGRRREGRTTGHGELFGVDGPTYCAATFSSKSALARGALPHTPHSPCGRKGRFPNRKRLPFGPDSAPSGASAYGLLAARVKASARLLCRRPCLQRRQCSAFPFVSSACSRSRLTEPCHLLLLGAFGCSIGCIFCSIFHLSSQVKPLEYFGNY